jgi:hypothetical protein
MNKAGFVVGFSRKLTLRFSRPFLILITAMGVCLPSYSHLALGAEGSAMRDGLSESLRSGDLSGAFRQTLNLAETNEIEAQHNLSLFYWHGVGAPQNFDEAIRWSTMAAIRGHKKAVAARKAMLEAIDPQVVKKAMEWARARLTKDAEAGDDTALMPLSTSYLVAFGAPNAVEAYVWAAISVSTGRAEARRQRPGGGSAAVGGGWRGRRSAEAQA